MSEEIHLDAQEAQDLAWDLETDYHCKFTSSDFPYCSAGLGVCLHMCFSATCPVLAQHLLVNHLEPVLCLHQVLLQLESSLFIPLYHKLPKDGKGFGRIKSNLKGQKAEVWGNRRTRGDTSPQQSWVVRGGSRCGETHASHPFILSPYSLKVPISDSLSWRDTGSVQPQWRQRQAQAALCQDGSALETRLGCNPSAFVGGKQHSTKCHSWPSHRLILSEVILMN